MGADWDDFGDDPVDSPVPDDDPLDCNGHGTHVAGIIGANPGNEFNITGVAYEASLYSYKVFGCSDSTATDVIIDGMLRAYEDGMDIISMSLGGNTGWSDDPTALVASRLANLGVVMSIAAGAVLLPDPWLRALTVD